jgi:site-specific recombinase XerD
MNRLDALIEGYLAYKRDVNRVAAGTLRDIRCSLARVVRTMNGIKPNVPLWQLTLEDYLRYVEAERHVQASSACISKYLTHTRGLLDYTWRSGRANRNVLDGFMLNDVERRTPPRSLTLGEAEQLIGGCSRANAEARRRRLIVLLLYGCGLRTHELCALNVEHVCTERRALDVLTAKGGKPRTVPVPEAVYVELLAYLHERGGKRGPLFRTVAKRKRIANKDVAEVVRDAARGAGLSEDVKPKTLRHSFATHLMDRGVDLGVIASLMGHRSPHETGVYLHVLPSRKERAVKHIEIRSQR